MNKILTLILSVCFIQTVSGQQSNEMPKPSPGHQKMLEWCGEWSITGKAYASPLGPPHDINGRWTGRPILDGFAIEGTYLYDGYGPCGETQAREVTSYDPATNRYHYAFLANTGHCEQAYFTVEGPVAAWEGTQVIHGKTYKFRGSDTDLPDGSGFIRKGELSADGKTWQPNMECRHIRVNTTSDKEELIRLAHVWLEAELKQDAATVARLWADDLTYSTSSGMVESKSEALAAIRSGSLTITHSAYDSLDARVYGDMGVTTGITTQKARYKDQDISGKYRFTDTWVKRDGRWQCVATHASKVPDGTEKTTTTQVSPEMKKLEVFVGDWTYEGQQMEPPVEGLPYGEAGTFSGKLTVRFVLDGAFQESRFKDDAPLTAIGLTLTGYDPKEKRYVNHGCVNDGSQSISTATLDGHIRKVDCITTTNKGDKVPVRFIEEYASDWSSYTSTVEASPDNGKTWKLWWKERGKKVTH